MDPQIDWDEAEVDAEVLCENLREIGRDLELLEEFGISLTDVNFDEKLVDQLDVIATFPKLRVLRLTQAPIKLDGLADTDPRIGPSYQRQWRYQQFAEQRLQRLVKKGSKVQLLAFSPTISHADEVVLEDGNGHRWPHYYYLRRETQIMLPGGKYATKVYAMPVKKDEIEDYMRWPRVLNDP
ncbi:hypothetical protein HBH56_154410 [Parastagonospora nodorum]|uniref:Uncharacterized protein n=1 Tax=Phaeosphaeria nodorum (strain SN15 / ATCC MYA-4574 / FGSC 10173) TaxID=321614 RepID=A0A7U2EZH1_PHANO|nr:hypothetical protein HBH56_154410 [Parastagonospora nodorum]QRC95936.1 hypothetical protein JI435_433020 [Parastagonospora nodorum SN15]KAH3970353.1 hypothetical protein HBH52_167590 [Parastagonospora nodorum]KAH4012413.1 hypothetical protein HBI13_186020 [Parastagonospora nodorum]KAH4047684.1 hypothetical protein HBH49_168360 [Parastagonospora nodorum]